MNGKGVVVRGLTEEDFEAVVAVDAKSVGRRREEFFRIKFRESLKESGIQVSLAAEVDGLFAGFLLARVYYGEFGALEPAAVLETIGVHPDFRGRGVGAALMDQLQTNLRGLGVAAVRTEVGWDEPELLGFFRAMGFRPAPRFVLELDPAAPRPGDRAS